MLTTVSLVSLYLERRYVLYHCPIKSSGCRCCYKFGDIFSVAPSTPCCVLRMIQQAQEPLPLSRPYLQPAGVGVVLVLDHLVFVHMQYVPTVVLEPQRVGVPDGRGHERSLLHGLQQLVLASIWRRWGVVLLLREDDYVAPQLQPRAERLAQLLGAELVRPLREPAPLEHLRHLGQSCDLAQAYVLQTNRAVDHHCFERVTLLELLGHADELLCTIDALQAAVPALEGEVREPPQ